MEYFPLLCQNYPFLCPADQTTIQTKIEHIFNTLSPDYGVWKYIDPLEETHDIGVSTIAGLPLKPITMICYNRFVIAFVGFTEDSDLGKAITSYIRIENIQLKRPYSYKHFDSISELNDYITAEDYGQPNKPTICFGIYFKENDENKYTASLHYFNDVISHGIEDVPNNINHYMKKCSKAQIWMIFKNTVMMDIFKS